jgi:predicted RNA-binding Zn-ribbon protein involved in translation (DUF1610 family)
MRQLRRRLKEMKIKEILSQHRRDFTALYECEGCGYTYEGGGYDDEYFHEEGIPKIRCPECGKTSAQCGADYQPLKTKYQEGFQV